MYIREKHGIDQLHGYSVGMVLNDCGHDDSELAAMLIQKAMRDNNVDLWAFDFDIASLVEYSQLQERNRIAQMYNHYISDFVLQRNFSPRQYEYAGDYVMEAQEFDESVRFYNCTKFEYFLNNPLNKFRVPIAYSYGNENTLLRHPGNTRYMAMMAMPDQVGVKMLITDFAKNKKIIEHARVASQCSANLAEYSVQEICDFFDFSAYNGLSVRYSNQVGIQVIEPHSRLPEFYQPYTISWTGREMRVNNTVIAQMHTNARHPKGFMVMPGTKQRYLDAEDQIGPIFYP